MIVDSRNEIRKAESSGGKLGSGRIKKLDERQSSRIIQIVSNRYISTYNTIKKLIQKECCECTVEYPKDQKGEKKLFFFFFFLHIRLSI